MLSKSYPKPLSFMVVLWVKIIGLQGGGLGLAPPVIAQFLIVQAETVKCMDLQAMNASICEKANHNH